MSFTQTNGSIRNDSPYPDNYYECQSTGVPYPSLAAITDAAFPLQYRSPGKSVKVQSGNDVLTYVLDMNLNWVLNSATASSSYLTNNTVGGIPSGTQVQAGESLDSLIKRMLVNPFQQTVPTGTINHINGLAKWRAARGSAAIQNAGGLDLVFAGDSELENYNAPDITFGMSHKLKAQLQLKYNRPGVIGGYGFLPIREGAFFLSTPTTPNGGYYTGWELGQVSSESGGDTAKSTINGKQPYFLKEPGSYINLVIDGTLPTMTKMQADRVQIIGTGAASEGITAWDLKEGSAPAANAGTRKGVHTHTTAPPYFRQGGLLFGENTAAGRDKYFLIDPTKKTYIRLSSGKDSATPPAGDYGGFGAFDGAVFYYGDYSEGVRIHNLSFFGRTISEQKQFLTEDFNNTDLGTGGTPYHLFGAGTTSGGVGNAKLYITDFITNDVEFYTTYPLQSFIDNYNAYIDFVKALPSQPDVLILIPHKKNNVNDTVYQQFRSALKGIAQTKNCALFDLNDYFGNGNYFGGNLENAGWTVSDGVHYSLTGQSEWANLIMSILNS